MGIINTIRHMLSKKEEVKTQPQKDIEEFIENTKQQERIDYMLEHERRNFLYGN